MFKYLPSILDYKCGEVLLPLRINIAHNGVRYMDCVLWQLYSSIMSPEDFASKLCIDLNFPYSFRTKIAVQLEEQIHAYRSLITMLSILSTPNSLWVQKLSEKLPISINIRQASLEYSDKIVWNLLGASSDPEYFARTTCADLGLPSEMEPVIAIHIRESIIRYYTYIYFCNLVDP
jgi:chromatin structure-remodeling complex subunit SFH1